MAATPAAAPSVSSDTSQQASNDAEQQACSQTYNASDHEMLDSVSPIHAAQIEALPCDTQHQILDGLEFYSEEGTSEAGRTQWLDGALAHFRQAAQPPK